MLLELISDELLILMLNIDINKSGCSCLLSHVYVRIDFDADFDAIVDDIVTSCST